MDFLVAARPQAAVLARIGVDKTLVSIEQEDPVMAIAARQIGADFIVEPFLVAAPDALNRFVPKGHALLLVQRARDETVDLALDRPLLHYLRGPIHRQAGRCDDDQQDERSEEHTSELQSLMRISYAVFCL